jgi:predicted RND superfamily exporter protein
VLSLSHWQSIASFGVLSGVTILMSLVAEVFLLPALIMTVSRGRRAAMGTS